MVRAISAGTPATVTDTQLALLLRHAQWALDDAAHDVPAGRATSQRRAELAGSLEALAVVLRASCSAGEPQLTQITADHRWSESCTPAPGARPDSGPDLGHLADGLPNYNQQGMPPYPAVLSDGTPNQ